MHPEYRFIKRPGHATGNTGTDHQSTNEAGATRIGDCIDITDIPDFCENILYHRRGFDDVVTRSEFGNNATIFPMSLNLRVQTLRHITRFGIKNRYPCLVTGAFYSQNLHKFVYILTF